jgi:hypothetical protein
VKTETRQKAVNLLKDFVTRLTQVEYSVEELQRAYPSFIALHHDKGPEAYLAFAYNPFIGREAYSHPFTAQIMDLEAEVLIGEEFWDKLGGEGTYQQLLDVIEEVKQETAKS